MKVLWYGLALIVLICPTSACVTHRGGDPLEKRVSTLVDETTKSERFAQRAFLELESLGDQVVPHLIGHLSDVRPLKTRTISLENKARDAFEGVRHYTPETVHDALAAILSQITGQSFVIVYNGATPQEREVNRWQWIEWCTSSLPIHADVCNGN
ncbi:hypothetical protein [Luteimonas sp. A478]